jgi:hypothetical protein
VLGNDPRILQRFPCRLEKEALLRVYPCGLVWCDAEEVRIE